MEIIMKKRKQKKKLIKNFPFIVAFSVYLKSSIILNPETDSCEPVNHIPIIIEINNHFDGSVGKLE